MNIVFQTIFGSHLYGTNTESSDRDYKAIYIPTKRELYLGRAKATVHQNTKQDVHSKSVQADIEVEVFSLQQYLKLLMEGQTVALDMLFTRGEYWIKNRHPVWAEIQENKNRFITKGVNSFVGYARMQAAKYGIKGSRMNALKSVLDSMESLEPLSRVGEHRDLWKSLTSEFVSVVLINGPGGYLEPHLEVVNRKIPYHASIKYSREILEKIYNQYGHRARLAQNNEGIDWKALMHAVRVNGEAKELLLTGWITFPRPDRELLLKIRKAEMPYNDVAEIIESGQQELQECAKVSTLRETPDREYADELVVRTYADA